MIMINDETKLKKEKIKMTTNQKDLTLEEMLALAQKVKFWEKATGNSDTAWQGWYKWINLVISASSYSGIDYEMKST